MTALDQDHPDHSLTTRCLLLCGAIGPMVFVVAFLLEGATRPNYDAWRTTLSTLSWGGQGWMQIANFLVFGLAMLAYAIGLRRVLKVGPVAFWAPILFAISGVCLITAGIFMTDPVMGYPPGPPSGATLHGSIHNLASLTVFLAIPGACFVLARRFARDPAWRGWALFSVAAGVAMLALLVWFFRSVSLANQASYIGPAAPGLAERLLSAAGCGWLSLLALKLMRRPGP